MLLVNIESSSCEPFWHFSSLNLFVLLCLLLRVSYLLRRAGKSVAVEEPSAGQVKVTLKASPVTFEDIRSVSQPCCIFIAVNAPLSPCFMFWLIVNSSFGLLFFLFFSTPGTSQIFIFSL